jgi:hypothetical protein
MWAGVYVLGVAGSDECPATFVRITDERTCSIAASSFGRSALLDRRAASEVAFGCSFTVDSRSSPVFFNTHRRGVASSNTRLLCAMAVTPAPMCPGCTAAPAGPPRPLFDRTREHSMDMRAVLACAASFSWGVSSHNLAVL